MDERISGVLDHRRRRRRRTRGQRITRNPSHRKQPRRRWMMTSSACGVSFLILLPSWGVLLSVYAAASTKIPTTALNDTLFNHNATEEGESPKNNREAVNQNRTNTQEQQAKTAAELTNNQNKKLTGSTTDSNKSNQQERSLHKEPPDSLFPTRKINNWDGTSNINLEDELFQHAQQLEAEQRDRELELNQQQEQGHREFMEWCQKVLGVQTSLEVHTFYYYDYMTALTTHPQNNVIAGDDDDDDFEIDDHHDANGNDADDTRQRDQSEQQKEAWQDPPLIPVRGLRTTRDIEEGEIVISIPFQALLTVSTTIDQDPVLSRVMGPKARKAYGWTLGQDESISTEDANNNPNSSEPPSVDFFELPLLAMALLHHRKLGSSSPLFPYINVLQNSPIDSMPFLWNKQQRREFHAHQSRISQGVETVARSIRQEMKDMYRTVVDTLATNHPDLFGKEKGSGTQQYDVLEEDDWAFSFEKFQWAFAMVNSRHWLLPIVDLETKPPSPSNTRQQHQPQGIVDGVPPAQMPTDEWLEQSGEDDDDGNVQEQTKSQQQTVNNEAASTSSYHSFLAPVADLLNFGPPCTRGRYNQETHTFDIIASCNFTVGQEVTFWYADECEDIIIGNYGFTHPMVPKCPTAEEYREKMAKWKLRATSLQQELEDAYEDMDIIDTELQNVQRILAECDCCETQTVPATYWMQHREQINPGPRQNHQSSTKEQGDGLHANYLRNPQEKTSRQIRGGPMMSRSGSGRSGVGGQRSSGRRSTKGDVGNARSRRSPRGSDGDDDLEHHGIRRMWAGRSGL